MADFLALQIPEVFFRGFPSSVALQDMYGSIIFGFKRSLFPPSNEEEQVLSSKKVPSLIPMREAEIGKLPELVSNGSAVRGLSI